MPSAQTLGLRLLSIALLLAAPFADADAMRGSTGDWPLWRGTPQHTGYQTLPGNISSPSVEWRQYIGGSVANTGLYFHREAAGEMLYTAPSGGLNSFFADGRPRWTRRYVQQATIVGAYDLESDGRIALVVAQTPLSRSSFDVFDAATGDLLWSSPIHDGGIGSVKVADIDGDGIQEIVWAPANSTFVAAYRVRRDGSSGEVWKRTIADYISDPYTPSSLAIGDITGDGLPDVVIAGGRGQIALMVFNGHDGGLMARTNAELPTGRTPESGGYGQSLVLADIDGDGTRDLVLIGSYSQSASFMFQGVITATWDTFDSPRVLDSYPYGMTFVDGSVADYDGDGRADILVSRFDDGLRAHELMLLDPRTLSVKGVIEGYSLASVIDLDTPAPTILAFIAGSTETINGARNLGAMHFTNGGFQPLPWVGPLISFPRTGNLMDERPEVDNAGLRAIAIDVNGDGVGELVAEKIQFDTIQEDSNGTRALQAVELSTGQVLRETPVPFVADVVGAGQLAAGADSRFAIAYNTGEVYLGGTEFDLPVIRVGGYFRGQVSDGHATELPVVADLDGDGANEIYMPFSNGMITRLDVQRGVPTATSLLRSNGSPRLLAISGPSERSLVVGGTNVKYQLRKIDWTGKRLWSLVKPTAMTGQVDLNVGRFGPFGSVGVVTGGGTTFPLPMFAYELAGARKLWRQNDGTYWDGTFAVEDFDGDGTDDIVTTFDVEKGRVISGFDGGTIAEPSLPPRFNNLNIVDYNGSPIIFDANGDGVPEVLIAEDDAHMMMLRVSMDRHQSSLLWSREQFVLDDERWSMPAIAPLPNSAPIIGVGTLRGVLLGVDSSGGGVRWETSLTDPAWTFGTNSVSSVVAVDIDGANGPEFIAGTESGRLFAVSAATGEILWSIHLGEALGDPVVADVDGDGVSEILVPCADGYLYAISGNGPARTRAVQH